MGQDITREELFDELCRAVTGDLIEIQPGEIPFCDVARQTGVKMDTLKRRAEKGLIPVGWEVVDRRGINGQTMKCYKKV